MFTQLRSVIIRFQGVMNTHWTGRLNTEYSSNRKNEKKGKMKKKEKNEKRGKNMYPWRTF